MSIRFPRPSGIRGASPLLLALPLLLGACNYGFVGGGLPSHIRSVAILPFDNQSPQPLLGTDVQQALQQELPRNLGVRLGAEATADAVVRGTITAYEETTVSVRPTGDTQPIEVPQRQVRIVYDVEIYDVRQDRPLWSGRSQSVVGNYVPRDEDVRTGRARAIDELIKKVIEGAQSQW